jgi:creatinine amidohydrolase/Fe(II)-dependent formamide hydrolase-like protein
MAIAIGKGGTQPSVRLDELTWMETRALLDAGEVDTAIITIGATEQHGPHLPLMTDALLAESVGEAVARRIGRAVLAPPIHVGCSRHHIAYAGTITLRPETLQALLVDYVDSLAAHDFRTIVLIPTHGGNFVPVAAIADVLRTNHPDLQIIAYTDLNRMMAVMYGASAEFGVDAAASGGHAGECEASIMLALRPDLVHMDRAVCGFLEITEETPRLLWEKGIQAIDKNGVMGDPRTAAGNRGGVYLERLVTDIAVFVSEATERR